MGKAGRIRAKQFFSLELLVKRHADIYSTLTREDVPSIASR
jgi:hypothetical protein